jgi:hypothetical protein
MQIDDKFTGLETDKLPGPVKSIEGYILIITGLNEEVSFVYIFQLLDLRRRFVRCIWSTRLNKELAFEFRQTIRVC